MDYQNKPKHISILILNSAIVNSSIQNWIKNKMKRENIYERNVSFPVPAYSFFYSFSIRTEASTIFLESL